MSEDALARSAARGEPGAFDRLARRFDGIIRRRAYRYHLPFGDFDDLYQEGRIGLWQAVDDWRERGAFLPFAIICIESNMLDALRAQLKLGHRAANDAKSFDDQGPEGDDVPLSERVEDVNAVDAIARMILGEEVRQLMDRVKAELTVLERQALVLRSMGYRQTEIAEYLDTTPGSINTALNRARKRLGIGDDGAPERDEARIVAMYRSGLTAAEIADQYSISDGTIRRILRRRGVAIRKRGVTGRRSHFAARIDRDTRLGGGDNA